MASQTSQVCPGPESTEENALRSLVRAYGLLERVMNPYFKRFGINGSQWGILRTLRGAELEGLPSLRLTDLSRRLLIRPPSVTGVVDRLEGLGLLVRDASITDQRAKQIRLTAKARELVGRILDAHVTQLECVLEGLVPAERAQLKCLLDRLGHHLEAMLEREKPDRVPSAPSR